MGFGGVSEGFPYRGSRYLRACRKGDRYLTVSLRDEHYFRGKEEINLELEELFQLFNQDALDKAVISCYCLMKKIECKRGKLDPIGFIDPNTVHVVMVRDYPKDTEDNMLMFLQKQADKEDIFFPYNFNFHFILLIIQLKKGVVLVMDSKRYEHKEWENMATLLQRAWKRFINVVPGKWKPELTFEDYPRGRRDVSSVLRSLHALPAFARHRAFPRFLPAASGLFPRYLPAGIYKSPPPPAQWQPPQPPAPFSPPQAHPRSLEHHCAMMKRTGTGTGAGQFPPPPPPPPEAMQFDIDAATEEESRWHRAERWRADRRHRHEAIEQWECQQREAAAGDPEAEENAEWEEAALADTIAAFDAATAEEDEAEEDEAEQEDDDDFEWSDDDGPHPDEAADQQRALVESFESEKKLQDDARAREEAQIRRAVELSLQAPQQERAGEDALLEQRRLLTALRMERWRA
ncbi:hypothetical protein QYE76_043022 [Lolium multiflorum]|uniref:Ubiquitin-like protease family profile domain-containing protein n=1 Tax=Lolium multiflorum TaxID=4521 RepID=A0AAD8WVP9_LOLMU|nr:hypothetical protein QYE76_043022 [Lolium multiflorum]